MRHRYYYLYIKKKKSCGTWGVCAWVVVGGYAYKNVRMYPAMCKDVHPRCGERGKAPDLMY